MIVTVDKTQMEFPEKTTYREIARTVQDGYRHTIVLAVADGKIRELFKKAKDGANVTFLTVADRIGHDTYVRSVTMLLMKAAADVMGPDQKGQLKVEFSVGRGLYCSPRGRLKITEEFVSRVKERMARLADQSIPFTKKAWPTDDAIRLFSDQEMKDKVQLFRSRRGSYINV